MKIHFASGSVLSERSGSLKSIAASAYLRARLERFPEEYYATLSKRMSFGATDELADLLLMLARRPGPLVTIIASKQAATRETLRKLLELEPDIRIMAQCCTPREVMSALAFERADLLLIDPDIDGILFHLGSLAGEKLPAIVVIADNNACAIQAFDAGAIDYLLKPIRQERLQHSIQRGRYGLQKCARFDQTAARAAARNHEASCLIIKSAGRRVFLHFDEIEFIEAQRNYVRIYVADNYSYLSREKVGGIIERLDPERFVRIHRSSVVNVSRISQIKAGNNSRDATVVLRNGKVLSCSRNYRDELHSLWKRNKPSCHARQGLT